MFWKSATLAQRTYRQPPPCTVYNPAYDTDTGRIRTVYGDIYDAVYDGATRGARTRLSHPDPIHGMGVGKTHCSEPHSRSPRGALMTNICLVNCSAAYNPVGFSAPQSNAPENLAALCQRCHLRWQSLWIPGQLLLPRVAAPTWMTDRGWSY